MAQKSANFAGTTFFFDRNNNQLWAAGWEGKKPLFFFIQTTINYGRTAANEKNWAKTTFFFILINYRGAAANEKKRLWNSLYNNFVTGAPCCWGCRRVRNADAHQATQLPQFRGRHSAKVI